MQCIITEKHSNETHYNETKERAHNSQIVRAEENLKLSHGGKIIIATRYDYILLLIST